MSLFLFFFLCVCVSTLCKLLCRPTHPLKIDIGTSIFSLSLFLFYFRFKRRQKSWANVLENKNKLRDLGTENQFPPIMLHCVAEKEPSHHSLSINRYLFFRDSLGRVM
ncbi:Uncharacterized protein APZ42_022675 [Daphnia magna]|uniref:Secreted protein n=1 Tax=Daphnia magna TaxID=35525 RepID=A0A164VNH9_9CRUS|nr:Uncharacterized protein APZ42_022675 [Daphnia magna]